MLVYEFYIRDNARGNRLLGILPERRSCPERVNDESIMRWARTVSSDATDRSKVFYLRVIVEKDDKGFFSSRSIR